MQRGDMTSARARVKRCLVALMQSHPFFSTVALHMDVVESRERPTLSCDGDTIFYNPDWVEDSVSDKVKAALVRVVLATVLRHHQRRGEREYKRWQLASAIVTAPILVEQGLVVADELKQLANVYDAGRRSVEQVYSRLADEGDDGSGGSGQGQGDEDDGQGQGSGKGQPQGEDPHGAGQIEDRPSEKGDLSPEESQRFDEMVQQALQGARQMGKEPGLLAEEIWGALNPQMDWRTLLRQYMLDHGKNDYSWQRPNRRLLDDGYYLPSLYSEEVAPLVFAIDTSGSMDSENLQAVWSEVRGCVSELRPASVTVIQCDARVHRVDEYSPDDLPEVIEAHGRGGTAFSPVWDYLEKHGIEPAVLIYHTDLGSWQYGQEPPYPVIWAVYDSFGGGQPPFGEVVPVEVDTEAMRTAS